jgi:hypothetical protein
MMIRPGHDSWGGAFPMTMHAGDTRPTGWCAFCSKQLPIVNGKLQPWRSPTGQLFCNEFCADDYDELRFRRHGRAEHGPQSGVTGAENAPK